MVVIPMDIFTNPQVIQSSPGDTNWHQITGWPPDPSNKGVYALASVAAAGGAGSMVWLEWSLVSAPSDTTHAWPLFGSGQVQRFGGGPTNIWYKLTASSDILVLVYDQSG